MSNSYRIRTEVGKDKSIKIQLDQDFEFLEILSLKIVQNQVYARPCSDYGVVVGRVSVNDGFGLPNCKVSIFVPLSNADSLNPIISDLYPYGSLSDTNDDGYRYNLLPYEKSYSAHIPTGTFFTREDVLTNNTLFEVYEKYFKYTAITNDSGDFMIFGVPVGTQTIHLDVDLSDIGEFSLSPQDLVRMGMATENQVSGTQFRSSTNLATLPQIISINKTIEVEPFWGQEEICNIGITRTDFDLSAESNVIIQPTAIFMGSIFSDVETKAIRSNCKPKLKQGELCSLSTGPGEILAIRQTIQQDISGKPILEEYQLEQGGQVIDENGAWLVDVPMNLDYVITNEFGDQVFSNDPTKGIPTKAKYRFKIKWKQSDSLQENIKRGYFLVPNIKEYGWNSLGTSITTPVNQQKSYAFSLDWNDYGDTGTTIGQSMIQEAINCEDRFYYMSYNKVYSVSQLIDRYTNGSLPNRFLSIKNILDDTCESESNKFPTNDGVFRMDIIYLLFLFFWILLRPLLFVLVINIHILYVILANLKIFYPLLIGYILFLSAQEFYGAVVSFPSLGLIIPFVLKGIAYIALTIALRPLYKKLLKLKIKPLNLPILLYDSCEFCNCANPDDIPDEETNPNIPVYVNASGVQISQLQAGPYLSNEITTNNLMLGVAQQMQGENFQINPSCTTKVPGLFVAYNSPSDPDVTPTKYRIETTSLTLAERINLFNTKAKYFDDGNNPGGGVNRIKVSFNPTTSLFHYDNITFMLLTPDSAGILTAGTLLSFQDPALTKDVNISGATKNQYENYAITGSSLYNTFFSKTIYFAKTDGSGNDNVTYTLSTPSTGDTNFHKFPTDIEYFQVITAMTYNQFSTQTSTQLDNSLNSRFLNNDMLFNAIKASNNDFCDENGLNCGSSSGFYKNPLISLDDYENHICVFLVRGVDPYSTRQSVSYGLGKIFGYNNEDDVKVTGNYKFNQPIIGGFKNVKHNLSENDDIDLYSNNYLYYETFNYQPGSEFSGFSSNLPSYYSLLDNDLTTPLYNCSCYFNNTNDGSESSLWGRRLKPLPLQENINNPLSRITKNSFLVEFQGSTTPIFNNPTNGMNRGYFFGEPIEGGSLMIMRLLLRTSAVDKPSVETAYVSSTYPETTTITYPQSLQTSRKLVMRGDRLPASTQNNENCGSKYLLQNNQSLGVFIISDDGIFSPETNFGGGNLSTGSWDGDNFSSTTLSNEVINSLNNCEDSVPLGCYYYQDNEFKVNHGLCEKDLNGEKSIWDKGCYKLVTTIITSIPTDLRIVTEWAARTNIVFGACRNVFSHTFTNNWINGTLYAFAFKNNYTFDSQNNLNVNVCSDLIYFDENTNNFYYRSSPYRYQTSSFVGSKTDSSVQLKNLKYPTTLIDLGPRSIYLQEISMSDDFDGYVVNNMKTTTFGDVADLFNIFIISRIANSNFINLIFSTQGANVFNYFNQRKKLQVDADYAQMISINSEFGVNEFDSTTYPENPTGQDPIYFNSGDKADGIFGIFFSSDTQIRDYISPKRTIINPNVSSTSPCAYLNINVFSQKVPFYQWEIKENKANVDNIFGSQSNTWYTTNLSGTTFFNNYYQQMDRVLQTSRYFQTQLGVTDQSYFKGYIYSVDGSGDISADPNTQLLNPLIPGKERIISVGAPYHFYFGLKKGKSAWDRFAKKWIGITTITD